MGKPRCFEGSGVFILNYYDDRMTRDFQGGQGERNPWSTMLCFLIFPSNFQTFCNEVWVPGGPESFQFGKGSRSCSHLLFMGRCFIRPCGHMTLAFKNLQMRPDSLFFNAGRMRADFAVGYTARLPLSPGIYIRNQSATRHGYEPHVRRKSSRCWRRRPGVTGGARCAGKALESRSFRGVTVGDGGGARLTPPSALCARCSRRGGSGRAPSDL